MHKPRKQNCCSRRKLVDWLEHLNDCEPSLVVPVGPRFQADVPEWKGPCNEEFGRRGGANLDDSRWLGTQTWPIKGSCVGAKGGKIGKGRSDSCSCTSLGSSDCIKRHVAEEQKRLHSNLGPAFRSWKFDVMGEDVSKSWTMEQQKKFNSLVRTNPVSQGSNFLDPATAFFSSKTQKDVVSYYLNVYLPKRISMKTHLGFKVLDSDDDEAGDATDDTNRPKRSRSRGASVGFSTRGPQSNGQKVSNRPEDPWGEDSVMAVVEELAVEHPAVLVQEEAQVEVMEDVPFEGTVAAPDLGPSEEVAAASVAEPAAIVVEPPAVPHYIDVPTAEAGEEAPAAPAQAPEFIEESSLSDDPIAAEIQDMAGRLTAISGRVTRRFSQLKEMEAAKEAARRAEAEVTAAQTEIAYLNDIVRRQQEKLRHMDERLRSSFRAEDLVSLSERKYWEGIRMCRRVLRLIHPRFPCSLLHPLNATALRVADLFGITGRPFPSSARAGPSDDPASPGPSEPLDPVGLSGLFEDRPEPTVPSGSQPPSS